MSDSLKEFNIGTGVSSIHETTGWWYWIKPLSANFTSNYTVIVYLDGIKVGDEFTMTKWGARKSARRVRSRYYRRAAMTPEIGPLR